MTTKSELLRRIVVDPNILVGKPTVRGMRISVEQVLAHLAENLDPSELCAAYPRLAADDIRACLFYSSAVIAGEDVFPEPVVADRRALSGKSARNASASAYPPSSKSSSSSSSSSGYWGGASPWLAERRG